MRRSVGPTVSGGKDYAGKASAAVIVQDDSFDSTDSITICAFATDPTDVPLFRLVAEQNERNGLRSSCRLMDKITTVPEVRMGAHLHAREGGEERAEQLAVPAYFGRKASDRKEEAGGLRLPTGIDPSQE